MKENQIVRRANAQTHENKLALQQQVEFFLREVSRKGEAEIMEAYRKYNKNWITYCKNRNELAQRQAANEKQKRIVVTLYADAFESSILKGHINIKKLKGHVKDGEYNEFERIFEFFREKSRWEKFVMWFTKKGFFKKGNNPMYAAKLQVVKE